MSKYEYRGLISAMQGAYALGSSGVELSSGSLVSRGVRSVLKIFSQLTHHLIVSQSKLLKVT